MTIEEATDLIKPAVISTEGVWADIGAGSGVFTQALMQLLHSGKIYAIDKSPHLLWNIKPHKNVELEVVEADFNDPLSLPMLDGLLIANTLHYAEDPIHVLSNIRRHMKEKASFILIEYETDIPLPPWNPYPIPFHKCVDLFLQSGFSSPVIKNKRPSVYNNDHMYVALAMIH